jgi:hypothetical protein
MVEYFQSIYVEPIIVDNASTYPPLLSWYETNPCKVIRLSINCGHRAPWEQGCVFYGDIRTKSCLVVIIMQLQIQI